VDLIDVCTPSHTHYELACAALEAGKHVLCEKPVGYDFRDTRRARDLARQNGLKTKVGLTFRYSPAMRYMRELVAEGRVGRLGPNHYSFMGALPDLTPVRDVTAPEVGRRLLDEQVDVVLLTPTWPLCRARIGSSTPRSAPTERRFLRRAAAASAAPPQTAVTPSSTCAHVNDDGSTGTAVERAPSPGRHRPRY